MQIDLDENTGQTESLKRVNYDITNHPKMSIFSLKKKKKMSVSKCVQNTDNRFLKVLLFVFDMRIDSTFFFSHDSE